jgi:hypothetical protein
MHTLACALYLAGAVLVFGVLLLSALRANKPDDSRASDDSRCRRRILGGLRCELPLGHRGLHHTLTRRIP